MINHLVIKPTYRCNQKCSYCNTRKETFKKSGKGQITVEEWKDIIHQADKMGNLYLDISGGEPLLYKYLGKLILEAKKIGWFVSLNTNGMLINEKNISELESVYLDQIILSCLSLNEQINDKLRTSKNSVKRITRGLQLLSSSKIRCVFHFIVNKYNYKELPSIIEYCFVHKVNSLSLVYPENAFYDNHLSLSEYEINEFRDMVLPRAIENYIRLYKNFNFKTPTEASLKNINSLYSIDKESLSEGIYQNPEITKCHKPGNFALIFANGDVLPCNGVEYTGEPIIGNMKNQSIEEIFSNDLLRNFRKQKMEFCKYCPIPLHTYIDIMTENNPPYGAVVERIIPEKLLQLL